MTKEMLVDIINEEIDNVKYGVNTFLVSEQIDDSDEREIRKIIRQEVSSLYSLNYLRKEKLGET